MSSRQFVAIASDLEGIRDRLDAAWTDTALEMDRGTECDVHDSIKSLSAIEEVLWSISGRLRKKEKEEL